eukprot:COSAG02_NODE_4946_length_4801_cov_2.406423_2_plen_118_part_00
MVSKDFLRFSTDNGPVIMLGDGRAIIESSPRETRAFCLGFDGLGVASMQTYNSLSMHCNEFQLTPLLNVCRVRIGWGRYSSHRTACVPSSGVRQTTQGACMGTGLSRESEVTFIESI